MNIRKTLKRLINDTQYVAALEKQNDLLKEKLQQEKDNLQKQKDVFKKEKEQEEADERGSVQETQPQLPAPYHGYAEMVAGEL